MSRINDSKILAKLVDKGSQREIRNTTISIRPLKIAFLLNREVGIEGLRKLIQFNSSVWNGIYNVIIPNDGSEIQDYWIYSLIQYDPDVIIRVGEFDQGGFKVLYDKIQPFSLVHWEDELLEPTNWKLRNPGAIHIYLYYNYNYKSFRIMSPSESNIRIPSYHHEDPNRIFIEAQFGFLPDWLDEFLEKNMHASRINFEQDDFVGYLNQITEFKGKVHPLYLTSYGIDHQIYNKGMGNIIVIAKPGSIDDVCLYWNLRSRPGIFAEEVHIVPYESLQGANNMNHFASWISQTIKRSNTVQLYSTSLLKDDLLTVKHHIKPLLKERLSRVDIRYGNFQLGQYRNYALQKQELIEIDDGIATFSPPRIPWIDNPKGMLFAVDLSFEKTSDKSKRFWPPNYPGLNKSLSENSRYKLYFVHGHRFRISGDRMSCLDDEYHDFMRVFLPDDEEIFQKLLEYYGLESNISEKCRYIRRTVDLFGGLDMAQPLKSQKWRKVFDKMCKESINLGHMREIYRPGKDTDKFLKTVNEFALKNIFLRGYKIRCPSCGYIHWYDVEEFREIINCTGCRASIQPPLECPFSYKLNDLVSRGVEQGLFPVLLTMLYLKEICDVAFHSLPGVEVTISGNNKQDLDVLAACDGRLVAAECKTLVACNTTLPSGVYEQIEKTAELSDKIGVHVLFLAALFSSPTADLKAMVDELSRRYANRMAIHILDKNHLEYERNYQDRDEWKFHRLNRYVLNQGIGRDGAEIRDNGSWESWF